MSVPKSYRTAKSIVNSYSNRLNVISYCYRKSAPKRIAFDKFTQEKYKEVSEYDLLPPAYFKYLPKSAPPVLHWKQEPGIWKKHPETGEKVRVNNVPVPVHYPKASQMGLWAGEGIVRGYAKAHKTRGMRYPRQWKPFITSRKFYSEILDKVFDIPCTLRALNKVDEAFGFDHYILKTSPEELNSLLGMTLKRHMLLALARKDMYPDDPAKREKVYNKYKQYEVPEEEAIWVGLTRGQAIALYRHLLPPEAKVRPLKNVYTEELLDKLKEQNVNMEVESEEKPKSSPSFISRIFRRGSKPGDESSV
ncbi:39S ribosomal protein L28, mitochondrial-like [Anneissia japonica]|uniref:39S ribosomal protein L28, mitochondrial-like n=1 Tax=Anneissia japonica TaxID=1529436 RepID=UPI0014257F75|nr:39S ribosomal protein L28, mitochondrial-like [Anneissia japonica]